VCFLGHIPVLAVGMFGGISCRIVVYLGDIPVLAVGVFGGISCVFFGIPTGFSSGCVRWDKL
jgi:hypothetical protein